MPSSRKIAVCDSETDPFKYKRRPEPFIWGYYDGETYESFRDTAKFIEFVSERDEIVYCHNGGKFDFFFLADYIDYLTPLTVINGRLTRFKIGMCEFRDSYTILPVPLGAHDKGEIDYDKMEAPVRESHMAEIQNYLYRDCVSLYGFVRRYIEECGLNLTLASGAMKIWTTLADIETPKTNQAFYEQFAPYYYGGRVECFELGMVERPFVVADINSAYPFAMLSDHAFGSLYIETNVLPSNRDELRRSFIRLTADSLGAFPYRDVDGSLFFPDDGLVREFTITGWEFDAARETGALRLHEVKAVFSFYEKVNFTDYVQTFFKKKAETKALGDKAGYLLAKLHLNSLYGKFGANPAEYHEYKTCHPADIQTMHEIHGYDFCDMLGSNAIMCRPISEAAQHYYNVATAASITGFVRAYLWRAIKASKRVLYVDTDSIAAESVDGLPLGDKLGQWDIEATCDRGAIAGKKLYAFHNTGGVWPSSGDMNFGKWKQDITKRGWKVSSKGVRLDEKQICRIASGETITHAKDAPSFSITGGVRFIEREIKMRNNRRRAIPLESTETEY